MAGVGEENMAAVNGDGNGDSCDLRSLLSSDAKDYLIRNNGDQVPLSDLARKTILLYFAAQCYGPCVSFLPKLIQSYQEIKEKGEEAIEAIFISSDEDQDSFDDFFSMMPWLALPYNLAMKESLNDAFAIPYIPMLVAVGPDGRTITTGARNLLALHGSDAFPFTGPRLKELEEAWGDMPKGWPVEVEHELHPQHALCLTPRNVYECDCCVEKRYGWSFCCEDCNYDLDPKCALEKV